MMALKKVPNQGHKLINLRQFPTKGQTQKDLGSSAWLDRLWFDKIRNQSSIAVAPERLAVKKQ